MSTPQPGKRVRGSRTGRPIMVLLDLFGRRWALRILYELRDGPLTFRELRARCEEVSPSVLNARLAELRDSGLVERRDGAGYALARWGEEIGEILLDLDVVARRWGRRRT